MCVCVCVRVCVRMCVYMYCGWFLYNLMSHIRCYLHNVLILYTKAVSRRSWSCVNTNCNGLLREVCVCVHVCVCRERERESESCVCKARNRWETADKETWGWSSQTVHRYRVARSFLSIPLCVRVCVCVCVWVCVCVCVILAGLLYTSLSVRRQMPHWAWSPGIVCVSRWKRVMADSTRPLTLLGSTSPPLFLLTLIRGSELHHTHIHTHTHTHALRNLHTYIQCASFGSAVSTIEKEKEDI